MVSCFLLLAIPTRAQVVGATLSGTIKDPSGAVIPGATVLIENTDTGVQTKVTTNAAGAYAAPNLSPGPYSVTVSSTGFQTAIQSGLTLTVGGETTSNFTLKVGKSSQTVRVSGVAAAAVQLSSPTMSAVVNQETVTTLPLNGRDWTQLATLQPGVSQVRSQTSAASPLTPRGNRGYGNQLSDSGHSPYENNYRVDGISINDYSNGAPGSVIGGNLGVDAIQEFSVETSTYSAAYGMASGAVINAVTKSGTNQFHGDVYGFLRDEGLDAKNYFDPASLPIPGFHRNQFGIDAGAPIRKDKMFIFGDYEGIRQNQSLSFVNHVPSLAARQGNLCSNVNNPDTAAYNQACPNGPYTVPIASDVLPYLALWPADGQNVPGSFGPLSTSGDTQQYSIATGAPYSEDYYTARYDWNISGSDKIDASFFYDKSPMTVPDALHYVTQLNNSKRQMYEVSENHIFSASLVNTARFGFNRVNGLVGAPGTALNPLGSDKSLAVVPGRYGPQLLIPGVTPTSTLLTVAFNSFDFDTYQFYDDLFLTHGNHSFRFGFFLNHQQLDRNILFAYNGRESFSSFADFLQGNPTTLVVMAPVPVNKMYGRQTAFGAYFTDAWKVRPNLTVTYGMRWEPTTLPTDDGGIPFQVLSTLTSPSLTTQNTMWTHNASLHDFEPRVGLAWDPFGTGKTSIRAGFGIYDLLPLLWTNAFVTDARAPFLSVSIAHLQPGDFPTIQSQTLGAGSFGVRYFDQHPPVAYNQVWSLNIQRSITPSLRAMIGYVGSHGVHLPMAPDDANWSLPTMSSAAGGYIWPCAPKDVNGDCTQAGGPLNPNVGGISPVFWTNTDKYNGLLAGLTKSMSHGLMFQASYTWGKCIDTGSNFSIPDTFSNALAANGGDYMYFSNKLTRGLCDYNVGQNFVFSYVWSIPTGNIGNAAKYLLGGWQIGGIVTAQSGYPFNVLISGDPLRRNAGDGNSDQPNRLPGCNAITGKITGYINTSCFTVPTAPAAAASVCNTNGFSAYTGTVPSGQVICANKFGNAGRNSLVGPKLVNVDFSVYKNVPLRAISEAFNVQFRASFFNILNHPNFLPPIDNPFVFNENGSAASNTGVIDGTSTTSRQVQLALKIEW